MSSNGKANPILGETSSLKARQDTTALMIGKLFKEATGSNELMMETILLINDDSERLQGMVAVLLNLLYESITQRRTQPLLWKELVDYLCTTVDIQPPG